MKRLPTLKYLMWVTLISLMVSTSQSTDHSVSPESIQTAVDNQDWETAESLCLQSLWNQRSGTTAFETALTLSRTLVIKHKAPQAMEWLETIEGLSNGDSESEKQRASMLQNLQRIYLSSGYRLNPAFRISGTELDGPIDLASTHFGELVVLDRYRQITLLEEHPNLFHPIPPTVPLPEKSQSIKISDSDPVIVTRYGYWTESRLNYFGSPDQLTRIIDATYTVDGQWLVLDRRNSMMLHVSDTGKILRQSQIPPLSGDEKIITNVLGGCWILHPSSRQILTAGAAIDVKIAFKGPGYTLDDPVDIASDSLGHLFVLCEDMTVTIFSPAGIRLRTVNLDPDNHHLYRDPRAITVSNDGRLFIADRKKHEIYCYH